MSWLLLKQTVTTPEGEIHARSSIPSNMACLSSKSFKNPEEAESEASGAYCVAARPDTLLVVVGAAMSEDGLARWIFRGVIEIPYEGAELQAQSDRA